ncbi:transposon protein, putative, CACTA, En/Spm sub-class [Panicum miliaceum]|uniref:Transposon protein, putative, CACTA, En/Spm sub-class n=1 Tax=Panicum miliaceum TaxID=4540 RepID=A0A3L6SEI2_PANMI|nr:transposon protein, putative, CACTA, En/Spm sub-class [Panicum miliaceum]
MEDEEPLRLLKELEDDTQQQDDDVVLLEDQRNSREEEIEDADQHEQSTPTLIADYDRDLGEDLVQKLRCPKLPDRVYRYDIPVCDA